MNTQEDDSLLYRSGGGRGKLLWFIGVGLFIAWNLLLFILAVVAIAKVNNQSTHGASYTYAPISRPFTVALNQQVKGGFAVSLQANGKLRLGGGTSVYLSRGPKPVVPAGATNFVTTSFNVPPSGSLSLLKPTELVFSAWTSQGAVYGTLGVLSLDGTSQSTWSTPQKIDGLTVSEAVVALSSIDSAQSKPSFVLAGAGKLVVGIVTSSVQSSLTFTTSGVQTFNGTENTLLARLTNTEFALAYATLITLPTVSYKMQATVGQVTYNNDGTFNSLKLSNAFNYAANRPYHAILPLVDVTKPATNEFVVAFPSANAILINSTNPPDDTLVILKGKWSDADKSISFGPSTSLVGVRPNVMLVGVGMPTTTDNSAPKGVLVFINENEDNAITAVSVFKDPATMAKVDGLAFGSTLKIVDNAADTVFQINNGKVVPFISASAVDDLKIGVAFSDLANSGKVTTTVLELSPYTMELERISAKFVISDVNPNILGNYWWVQTAPLRFASQTGYAVWSYLQTGVGQSDIVMQSVVELAPPPLGIVPDNAGIKSAGASVPVIVSGVYKSTYNSYSNNLGRNWYTDTLGVLHVRNVSIASIDYVVGGYDTLLSLNSRVGVSISDDELLLVNELS